MQRIETAKNNYSDPVIIVTQDEAIENEKNKSTSKKTWSFEAKNVEILDGQAQENLFGTLWQ